MPKKIVQGADLEYTIVPFNQNSLKFDVLEKIREICYEEVEGFIKDGRFFSATDNFKEPVDHWSLEIVKTYETEEPWLLINKRPCDLYFPMSYILKALTYAVVEFDIWSSEQNDKPIAVVTEVDSA